MAGPRPRRPPDAPLLIGLGVCLAVMNSAFYLALDRLPMSLVAAIEFVGTIGVALYGLRTARNLAALALAVLGAFLLINVRWSSDPMGSSGPSSTASCSSAKSCSGIRFPKPARGAASSA